MRLTTLYGVTSIWAVRVVSAVCSGTILSTSTFTKLRDWSAPDLASHVYAKFLEELINTHLPGFPFRLCRRYHVGALYRERYDGYVERVHGGTQQCFREVLPARL